MSDLVRDVLNFSASVAVVVVVNTAAAQIISTFD